MRGSTYGNAKQQLLANAELANCFCRDKTSRAARQSQGAAFGFCF
jgi:hypothetical protein